jgi:hypothetical protein
VPGPAPVPGSVPVPGSGTGDVTGSGTGEATGDATGAGEVALAPPTVASIAAKATTMVGAILLRVI